MKRDNTYLIGNQYAVGQKPNRTTFKPGQEPWNKGLKGWCPDGCQKTQFKKGQPSTRTKEVGCIKIRTDKNGAQRRWIKVSNQGPRTGWWKIYASWLWEKERGEIPNGLFIHHIDGNSLNDQISNYALTTRSAHMRLHASQLLASRRRDSAKPGSGYVRSNEWPSSGCGKGS